MFEKGKEKLVYSILKFSSIGQAEKAFTGIYEDLKNRNTYPVSTGKESIGIHSESADYDGTLVRVANIISFIILFRKTGTSKKESTRYVDFLKLS